MTITEDPGSTPSSYERWAPRHWSLLVKLIVMLIVPTVLALVLGVLRIADQAGAASELDRVSRFAAVQGQVSGLINQLQQERYQASTFVAEGRADQATLQASFAAVDEAGDEARTALGTIDDASSGFIGVQSQQATQTLDRLPALRNLVTASTAPPSAVIVRYTELIRQLLELDNALVLGINTTEVNGLASALGRLGAARDETSLQYALLTAAVATGSLPPQDAAEVQAAEARLGIALADYRAVLDPGQRARHAALNSGTANVERQRLVQAMVSGPGDTARPVQSKAEVSAAFDPVLSEIDGAGSGVREELVQTSGDRQETASNLAGANSVILMLALLAASAIVFLVARTLLRSLRTLRLSALEVAERRLPQTVESMRAGETPNANVEPVPIVSRDEVGQVARAFDAVHGQAVRLAADQAALQANVNNMFVNLSRRSQALVERQLQLIEQLESNEQDPDQLSNLFQLDHLATRMRRNSENLLVLAGTDLSKRNVAPVPVVDVLRAAVSEIEQYQRVVVQAPPTATVMGRAASDLVHLLAELLDNATNFSPPDSQVVMSTTRTVDGSILVEIADRGVGMADHELSDANQRLGGPSAVDVSASRRMGLFVVGRLAARHGVGVRLGTSEGGAPGGLTASVTVPSYLIPSSEPDAPRHAGAGQLPAVPPGPQDGSAPQNSSAPQNGVVPQNGATAQQPATNGSGNGRAVSLSSLVAGADGPMSPVSFEPGPGSPGEHPSFPSVPINGSGPALPTRRPGSTLRRSGAPAGQDGQARPADPGPGESRPGESRPPATDPSRNDDPNGLRPPMAPGTGQRPVERSGGTPAAPHAFDAGQGAPVERSGDAPTTARGLDGAPPRRNGVTPGSSSGTGRTGDQQAPPPPPPPTTPLRAVPPADGAAGSPAERGDTGKAGNADNAKAPEPPPGPRGPVEATNGRPAAPVGPAAAPPVPHAPPAPPPLPTRTPRPALPPATSRPQESLFAPSVPVIADPKRSGQLRRPGAELRSPAQFDMGQTTPIFEEIASAWFRSNRPVPVNWATEKNGAGAPAERPAGPAAQAAPAAPAPPAVPMAPSAPEPPPAPAAEPVVEQPAEVDEQPAAKTPASDPGFATTADEGWRAAEGTAAAPASDELTAAGLPKRRPRARLVPGSAAGSAVLAAPSSPSRTAEAVRGRLASYQQGVRQGRESRLRQQAQSAAGSHQAGEGQDEETR
ncbi:nitrate- and nitrite sensing domain-containing protein [Pseudonocardia sp. H11422]|uniref:sensor histidine kinase n=1 Tax=Pseudonocardia sp. H11422 TaxID=2835866 RepID=UPI00292F86EB|nr:nitrate- and nitrite sensing domain-containing protein [Pseudonocardia sp. H11422]